MPSIIHSQTNNLFASDKLLNEYSISHLFENNYYCGIGKSDPWGLDEGTGINDDLPPIPFFHSSNLHQPLLYKKLKFVQPAILETFTVPKEKIIKKIDKDFYNLDESLLVLNKFEFTDFELYGTIKYYYFEVEFLPEDFENFDFNSFRELAIYENPVLVDPETDQDLIILKPEQIEEAPEPAILQYFTPQLIESKKIFNFKYLHHNPSLATIDPGLIL